jgi:hypothetical protein
LADFGEARIAAMDGGGVGLAVLSISGPGVLVEPDTAQNPIAAADELERSVRDLEVKVTVVSEQGKEAVVAIHGTNDFFGEGCLTSDPKPVLHVSRGGWHSYRLRAT